MKHTYNISGMTCGGCLAKVKSELLKVGNITAAEITLRSPQASLTMQTHIPVSELQKALSNAGNFNITEVDGGMHTASIEKAGSWFATYKPLLLIGGFIVGITLLLDIKNDNLESWMRHFMGSFFIVFSFFKFLDLKGFAESYSTYDLIARKWRRWGYVYACIELLLGLGYILGFNSILTNSITFVVMGISFAGVYQSVVRKERIQCACLGTVFKLPMSSITLVEDGLMIAMSMITIITLL